MAWANSSALTAADSSLEAEFVCTTADICPMPSVTWAMDSDSSRTASAITPMSSLERLTSSMVSRNAADTSSTIPLPRLAADTQLSISLVVAAAASSDWAASRRTSSATTAKPFPASPALAASTAAFRASILVWNAMFCMVVIIWPICSDELLTSCMAETICSIFRSLSATCSPVSWARSWAPAAVSTLFWALLEMPSSVAYSS